MPRSREPQWQDETHLNPNEEAEAPYHTSKEVPALGSVTPMDIVRVGGLTGLVVQQTGDVVVIRFAHFENLVVHVREVERVEFIYSGFKN